MSLSLTGVVGRTLSITGVVLHTTAGGSWTSYCKLDFSDNKNSFYLAGL